MSELNDHELLAQYARAESEAAFTTLVARYGNLVYSTGLRFTSNPHYAQEITQAVFIVLARKARGLRRGTVLSGWLYQTARLTAANFVKGELRRQRREQEAYMQSNMQSTPGECDSAAWEHIAPLLDEAMGRLGETDRNAIVLRFFENKSTQEVGAALKLKEAAAHKRVSRALEKLRKLLSTRGVTLSAAGVAGAVSANSVQAAPAGLALAVTTAAAKSAAASATTTTLVEGTMKTLAWLKVKFALLVSTSVLVAGGTAIICSQQPSTPDLESALIGKWERVGKPGITVIFLRDGTFSADATGERLGGKYQLITGGRIILDFDASSPKPGAMTNTVSVTGKQLRITPAGGKTERYTRAAAHGAVTSSMSIVIEPGVCVGPVRSGMTMQQAIAELGEPDQNKESSSILEYHSLGLTFLRGNKAGLVGTVICSDSGRAGTSAKSFAGHTKEGIGIGSSRAEVISAYGEPTVIEPARGNTDSESLRYGPLGLDFRIRGGKVRLIAVFFKTTP